MDPSRLHEVQTAVQWASAWWTGRPLQPCFAAARDLVLLDREAVAAAFRGGSFRRHVAARLDQARRLLEKGDPVATQRLAFLRALEARGGL